MTDPADMLPVERPAGSPGEDRIPVPYIARPVSAPPAPVSAAEQSGAWDVQLAKATTIANEAGDILPKDYRRKPGAVLLAMMWADAHDIDLFTTMQEVSVAYGRPSVSAAMRQQLAGRAGYDMMDATVEAGLDPRKSCVIRVTNRRTGESKEWREDLADVPAHLFEPRGENRQPSPWEVYPADMLYAFTARRAHKRLVGGVSSLLGTDEVEDEVRRLAVVDVDEADAIERPEPDAAPPDVPDVPDVPKIITAEDLKAAMKDHPSIPLGAIRDRLTELFPLADPPLTTLKRIAEHREAATAVLAMLRDADRSNI